MPHLYGPINTQEADDQTKTFMGIVGGLIAIVAGWFGLKKQSEATKAAEVAKETTKIQAEADAEAHIRETDIRKTEAKVREHEAEERVIERLLKRIENLESSHDIKDKRISSHAVGSNQRLLAHASRERFN